MLDASTLDQLDGICYLTGGDGRIIAVGASNWDEFAFDNEAVELSASAVVGRNLFDFVCGQELQGQLRGVLLRLASGLYDAWIMPYRCDSPAVKRNMRLSIRPVREQDETVGFLFQSVLLNSEDRPRIDLFDFKDRKSYHSESDARPTITMCSYCQRVRADDVDSGTWLEPEAYYARGGSSQVRISHGICDACLAQASNTAFQQAFE